MKSCNYLVEKCTFVTVKVAHSFECLNKREKIFWNPQRGGRRPQISVGSSFYGFLLTRVASWVASPTQGQKSRFISTLRSPADKAATTHLLNLFQGLTCKPVREPKLYYTVTSFDAIMVRVSQFSLGGRGLTYFFLTYCLPFPILCNP